MIRIRAWTVLAASLSFILCGSASAYDPLFLVTHVEGDCSVIRAGSEVSVPARSDRAYPYESQLITGLDGSAKFVFGEGSECVLGPNTMATMTQDSATPDWKQVRVYRGSATLELIDEFNRNGSNRITVETLGAIAEPTAGGEFVVEVTTDRDLTVASFHTVKGEMKLYDNYLFEIPALKNDARAEVAASQDKSFIRYRNIRGKQIVDLKNLTADDGGPKVVEMSANSMLKMWRERSKIADAWVVSILIVASDGSLVDAINYNSTEIGN